MRRGPPLFSVVDEQVRWTCESDESRELERAASGSDK